LKLVNQDVLVGGLTGTLKLDTAFDTLTLNGPEVAHISRSGGPSEDVQITLWDKTVVSGELEDPTVRCVLKSGATVEAPVSLIDEYDQPFPTPSAAMVEKIRQIAGNLNADDWKERDAAQTELTGMGQAVVGVLKEMRGTASPETQSRIDEIVAKLGKPAGAPDVGGAAGGGAGAGMDKD
jgi:hypothetical protein